MSKSKSKKNQPQDIDDIIAAAAGEAEEQEERLTRVESMLKGFGDSISELSTFIKGGKSKADTEEEEEEEEEETGDEDSDYGTGFDDLMKGVDDNGSGDEIDVTGYLVTMAKGYELMISELSALRSEVAELRRGQVVLARGQVKTSGAMMKAQAAAIEILENAPEGVFNPGNGRGAQMHGLDGNEPNAKKFRLPRDGSADANGVTKAQLSKGIRDGTITMADFSVYKGSGEFPGDNGAAKLEAIKKIEISA